jgi:hypothetical protein
MTSSDLQTWLEVRNARLFRTLHPQGYVVVIVSLSDTADGVQVVSDDLEKGVLMAQAIYDLPRADRQKISLLIAEKETGKC